MKNFLFGMLVFYLGTGFYACQKDDSLSTQEDLINEIISSESKALVSPDDLPSNALDYVVSNHAPYGIESAWLASGKGYELALDDGEFLYFNESGRSLGKPRFRRPHRPRGFRCLLGDTLQVMDLPDTTTTYIADNYPNETIETVISKPFGSFAVQLSNGDVLIFNADGLFIRNCGGLNYCMKGDTLSVADLPDTTTTFIAENYPGETIETVVSKYNGWYAVELSNGDVLVFNSDGIYVRPCGKPELPGLEDLPQSAQDYIMDNYPDSDVLIVKQLPNGNWIVWLSGPVKLIIDADGNILFDSGD